MQGVKENFRVQVVGMANPTVVITPFKCPQCFAWAKLRNMPVVAHPGKDYCLTCLYVIHELVRHHLVVVAGGSTEPGQVRTWPMVPAVTLTSRSCTNPYCNHADVVVLVCKHIRKHAKAAGPDIPQLFPCGPGMRLRVVRLPCEGLAKKVLVSV